MKRKSKENKNLKKKKKITKHTYLKNLEVKPVVTNKRRTTIVSQRQLQQVI